MDASVLYRLVLTRAFFEQAKSSASHQDATSLALAVVGLHDAFDNLLGAIATHVNLHVPDSSSLMKTFDRLASAHRLPGRIKLEQLNAIRNAVKHQGLHPNPAVVHQMLPELVRLADEISQLFFAQSLTDIRLINLIANEDVRREMAAAADEIVEGRYKNALEHMAFIMFRVYELRRVQQAQIGRWLRGNHDLRRPGSYAEYPEIPLTDLRLDFVELGLDPLEYDGFHLVVPRVGLAGGVGSDTAYVMTRNRYTWHLKNWTRENCELAFNLLLRLILAQEKRASRPVVIFEQPLDKVRFVRQSAIFRDAEGEAQVATVSAGDEFYVADLPFIEGRWQGLGSERANGQFHHENKWKAGYINKLDVEVTPYATDSFDTP